MYTPVTLQPKDFRDLHNALCDIRQVNCDLEQFVGGKLHDRLAAAIRQVEQSLQDVYAQESADFDTKSKHYEQVREAQGFRAIWSLFEVNNLMALHPWDGATHVVYGRHWGGDPVTVSIPGPRWVDLYNAANQVMLLSGDSHHVYVEAFKPLANTLANNSYHLEMTTGS
jgi:hypothetical protein